MSEASTGAPGFVLLQVVTSRSDVWDVGAITSLFAMSNRHAHLAGTSSLGPC